jgi:uncharacterized protein (DUF1684 family)
MQYNGINDSYLPTISKPSLQQYDNYQIHDLYCRDIIFTDTTLGNTNIVFKKFLAVETVSPVGSIECDFNAIANQYK